MDVTVKRCLECAQNFEHDVCIRCHVVMVNKAQLLQTNEI